MPPPDRRARCRDDLTAEHRSVHGGQLRGRIGAQPVGESLAGALEQAECFRWASCLAHRTHECGNKPLAQRVLHCERRELGDQVRPTAEPQLCTDPVFYRSQPELVEPRDGRLEELLVEDVQQCWSPPEAESVSQRLRGGSRIAGQLGTSGGNKSARTARCRHRPTRSRVDSPPDVTRSNLREAPGAAVTTSAWRAFAAPGGGPSPQTASISREVGISWRGVRASAMSSVRNRMPATGTAAPSSSVTSSGLNIAICT
mgnify:CR=1 FL=1